MLGDGLVIDATPKRCVGSVSDHAFGHISVQGLIDRVGQFLHTVADVDHQHGASSTIGKLLGDRLSDSTCGSGDNSHLLSNVPRSNDRRGSRRPPFRRWRQLFNFTLSRHRLAIVDLFRRVRRFGWLLRRVQSRVERIEGHITLTIQQIPLVPS